MQYCLGFAFNEDRDRVVLIEKKRPAWQAGKFNGVGGKMEVTDLGPLAAMVREFREETGVRTAIADWERFCTIRNTDNGVELFIFRMFGDSVMDARTKTDENIRIPRLDEIPGIFPVIPNLKWLIPLALSQEVRPVNMEFV